MSKVFKVWSIGLGLLYFITVVSVYSFFNALGSNDSIVVDAVFFLPLLILGPILYWVAGLFKRLFSDTVSTVYTSLFILALLALWFWFIFAR